MNIQLKSIINLVCFKFQLLTLKGRVFNFLLFGENHSVKTCPETFPPTPVYNFLDFITNDLYDVINNENVTLGVESNGDVYERGRKHKSSSLDDVTSVPNLKYIFNTFFFDKRDNWNEKYNLLSYNLNISELVKRKQVCNFINQGLDWIGDFYSKYYKFMDDFKDNPFFQYLFDNSLEFIILKKEGLPLITKGLMYRDYMKTHDIDNDNETDNDDLKLFLIKFSNFCDEALTATLFYEYKKLAHILYHTKNKTHSYIEIAGSEHSMSLFAYCYNYAKKNPNDAKCEIYLEKKIPHNIKDCIILTPGEQKKIKDLLTNDLMKESSNPSRSIPSYQKNNQSTLPLSFAHDANTRSSHNQNQICANDMRPIINKLENYRKEQKQLQRKKMKKY